MKKYLIFFTILSIFNVSVALASHLRFTDVPHGQWYSEAVGLMEGFGIVKGYSDNTFRPSQNVNRAELSVMLLKTLKHIRDPYTMCVVMPEITDIGRPELLVSNKYPLELGFLGAIFTADDCGLGNYYSKVWGVDNDIYTLGSSLQLDNAPSSQLLTVLKEIGYESVGVFGPNNPADESTTWLLKDANVQIIDILKLKPFYQDFASADCYHCG